ncbi:hypothetical protein LZ554_003467 [Drepanopeziza brunnea f. sp. 'monogermtubi']|nr:hypothetical protein LZ554_003467 [Drepanopeziza brunnea f. sp. 'monogermtubi']
MKFLIQTIGASAMLASIVYCLPQDTTTPAATTTASVLPSCTPLQQAVQATNPFPACPQPSAFTIADFQMRNNSVSLRVTYTSSVNLICPNRAHSYYESVDSRGVHSLTCDIDGLARVSTDGYSWLTVSQNQFCAALTGCRGGTSTSSRGPSTVAIQGTLKTLADEISCVVEADGTRTCTQLRPVIEVPVTGFSEGPWILGNSAMALDGTPLPQCTTRWPPWVTNTANCDAGLPAATGV